MLPTATAEVVTAVVEEAASSSLSPGWSRSGLGAVVAASQAAGRTTFDAEPLRLRHHHPLRLLLLVVPSSADNTDTCRDFTDPRETPRRRLRRKTRISNR